MPRQVCESGELMLLSLVTETRGVGRISTANSSTLQSGQNGQDESRQANHTWRAPKANRIISFCPYSPGHPDLRCVAPKRKNRRTGTSGPTPCGSSKQDTEQNVTETKPELCPNLEGQPTQGRAARNMMQKRHKLSCDEPQLQLGKEREISHRA